MHRKLKEFFDTKGRRLAELKAKGGTEFIVLGKTELLSQHEIKEFRTLSIQMDAIIWALEPKNSKKREAYVKEITNYFANIEEPYFKAQDIKDGMKVLRTKA